MIHLHYSLVLLHLVGTQEVEIQYDAVRVHVQLLVLLLLLATLFAATAANSLLDCLLLPYTA